MIGTIFSSLVMIGHGHAITVQQGLLVLASSLCLLSFQFLLIQAYRFADPSAIGAFQYSSVIFAGVIGWLWFQQIPNLGVVLGSVLICIGGALSILWQAPPRAPLPSVSVAGRALS
jgi:drug/metabolite transporter (DMT)-like permease